MRYNITTVDDLPPCTAQNYCVKLSSNQVGWCYIDENRKQDFCRSSGFCGKRGLGISFEARAHVAVLGHELREEGFTENMTAAKLAELKAELTEDLWMNTPKDSTSILAGFVYDGSVCTSDCCGLQVMDLKTRNASACKFTSLADVEALEGELREGESVTLVWMQVAFLSLDAEGRTVEDCQDQCMLDEACKSFLVAYDSTLGQVAAPTTCYFFSQNAPYHVYRLDRTQINETAVAAAAGDVEAPLQQVIKERARKQFSPALMPYSRLFNSLLGIHVSDDAPQHARDMVGGPLPEAGLVLRECQDRCVSKPDCHAIAFPGCYLLSESASLRAESAQGGGEVGAGLSTMAFVKRFKQDKVVGVAGFPRVYSFKGEGEPAEDAYLDRPVGCAVDSKGSVHFVDAWNQRVRKISGYQTDCVHAHTNDDGKASYDADIAAYSHAIGNVMTNCTRDPHISALFASLKQQTLDQHNATPVSEEFCSFTRGPLETAAQDFYQAYTRNTLVLCRVCESLTPRPAVCPWESMCACRDAIVQVLHTEVYQRCQAPRTYHDTWHVFTSSFVSCWWKSAGEALWLLNTTKRQQLEQSLQSYR